MKSLALLLAPMLLVAGPAQAALSPQERAMAVSVDADHDASVVLLEKWMNQNSGSMNLEGVRNLDNIRRRASARRYR